MMRCKKHHSDLTSLYGVCASCVRQRLFALLAAQQAQAQAEAEAEAQENESENKSPVCFPEEEQVSPHRKSSSDAEETCTWKEAQQLFYTPPQTEVVVALTGSVTVEEVEKSSKETKKTTISSMIKGFFRSKKPDQDHGGKKKETRACALGDKACRDRGMSPDVENFSSEGVKQTPRRMPGSVRRNGHSRNVSGLKICLSPLVRASPNVRCGGGQVETAFCKNRSRKLADFGRNNNY